MRCDVDLKDRWTTLFEKFESGLDKVRKEFMVELQALRDENGMLRTMLEGKIAELKTSCGSSGVKGGTGPVSAGTGGPSSFAAAVGTKSKVIIKPKASNLSNSEIRADILKKINPVDSNIGIGEVRNLGGAGILISCNDAADRNKLVKLADERLASEYNVHELKSVQPKVRIVGMAQSLEETEFLRYLRAQNQLLFSDDSKCSLIKISAIKNDQKTFQATIGVDVETYARLMGSRRVVIGFDSCVVYDAVSVLRCFKCNAFHHMSANCPNTVCCPVCAGPHELKSCKSETKKCSNCESLRGKKKTSDIATDHAAFEYNYCQAYKQAVDRLKNDLIGPSST